MATTRPQPAGFALLRISIRRHATSYFSVLVVVIALNVAIGGLGWAFWPLYGWGVLLALHYFYTKSVNVPDEWVDERAEEMRLRSYDLDHIRNIQERVGSRHPSVINPEERDSQ